MSDLYKRIEALCKVRSESITEMCRASGASRGSLTDLKSGRLETLSQKTLQKIAGHFEVTVDALLTGEQKEKPVDPETNGLDEKLLQKLIQLTPEEETQVDAFVQGLLAARKEPPFRQG